VTSAPHGGPSIRITAVVTTVAATLGLASCSGGDGADAEVVIDGIAVHDAWVRPTPPGGDEAAIYVTVGNETDAASAILGASSSRCMVVVPHTTTIDDGIASMGEALDAELALSAGGRVEMEPNGLHLMCLGLDDPLQAGEQFDITLDLAGRDPIDVTVDVEQR
jgi:copper(I)-binding protein